MKDTLQTLLEENQGNISEAVINEAMAYNNKENFKIVINTK